MRRALGLLALCYLVGATLEPAAHAVLEAAEVPAPSQEEAPHPVMGAEPDQDPADSEAVHDEFECVLCHAAGSVPLTASGTPEVMPDDSSGLSVAARAPPLPSAAITEGQPRAPPLSSQL